MRKHFLLSCVGMLAVLAGVFACFLPAKADEASPWITSSLNLQKQSETLSLPASLNGNIDCYRESGGSCVVPVLYGAFDEANSKARFNSDGGYKPILNFVENRQRVLAVPNSPTLISYSTSPVFGWNLYFNNAVTSIEPGTAYIVNALQPVYKLTTPPDGALADKSGNLLPGDYATMSFDANSKWLVVVDPNVATLRVNLKTLDALPFGPRFQYGIGNPPDVKTAVTNDGRYAVEASYNQSRFTIYDLDSCSTDVPATITGPVNCQFRDLRPYLQQKIPGFRSATNIRFLDNNTLSFYGSYYVGSTLKTAKFILSTEAIEPGLPYLALGDSYISGEGAFDYTPETDTENNLCHLSFLSYPYLINNDLGFSSNTHPSVACSGAVTEDIVNTRLDYVGQADRLQKPKVTRDIHDHAITGDSILTTDSIFTSLLPGYINQLDFVSRYQPKAITVSIGGNDMGFSKILSHCVEPWQTNTCYSSYEDRVELVREINNVVFNNLVDTYAKLKSAGPPDMRIYTIGYPQIANPNGNCGGNVLLNHDELVLSQQLIAYLDSAVQKAAAKTGVYYVDTQSALEGHRLCEADGDDRAMNGFTLGDDRPRSLGGPIGDESYHPTALGYRLIENRILEATDNLTIVMPAVDSSSAPPSEAGLEILNAPKSGRQINLLNYDANMSNDVVYDDGPVDLAVNGISSMLKPLTTVDVVLHSEPINLGQYTTDEDGNLSASVTFPKDIPNGFHALDIYGSNILGQPVDIQKIVYVSDKPKPADTTTPANTESDDENTVNVEQAPPAVLDTAENNRNGPTAYQAQSAASSLLGDDKNLVIGTQEYQPEVLGISTANQPDAPVRNASQSSSSSGPLKNNWPIASAFLSIAAAGWLFVLWRLRQRNNGLNLERV